MSTARWYASQLGFAGNAVYPSLCVTDLFKRKLIQSILIKMPFFQILFTSASRMTGVG
jgi:hypothetical protein